MSAKPPFVSIDAPPPDNHRAAAALALAVKLREEFMNSSQGEPPPDPAPIFRLVHSASPQQSPARKGDSAPRTLPLHAPETNARARYFAITSNDVKRLERIAHLLTALTGELNLWLSSVRQEEETAP